MATDQPNEVDQSKPQARGHLIRTGHKLTGYYVATDHPGIVRLVRTCACADDGERAEAILGSD